MTKYESKHSVPLKKGAEKLCPICGESSYSLSGVHPQCAITQADAPRVERLKAARKVEQQKDKPAKPRALTVWQKRCPKCGGSAHVRSSTCQCGHSFVPVS